MVEGRPRHPVPACGFCKKEFKRQEHLERHLRTHTKERPYKCDCERRFTRQDLLHRHLRLGQCHVTSSDPASRPAPQISRRLGQGQNPPFHINEYVATSEAAESATRRDDATIGALTFADGDAFHPQSHLVSNTATSDSQHVTRRHDGNSLTEDAFTMDTIDHSSFLELQPLEMDFLFDEADMINNHLAQNYPPLDFDLSPAYSESTLLPTASTLGSNAPVQSHANRNARHTLQQSDQSPLNHRTESADKRSPKNPWDVSEEAYARLSTLFTANQDPSDTFHLPSRRTISRYVASWARSYHPHLPVLHLPTKNFDIQSSMLLLTLASVGSFYVFEHSNGYPMLVVAKSIVLDKLRARRQRSSLHLLRNVPQYATVATRWSAAGSNQEFGTCQESFDIELLQSLLIIVMTLVWLDKPFTEEGLALSSQLCELTREALRDSHQQPEDLPTWEAWAQAEERRRTIYCAYFTLNLLTICFNVPPPMATSEVSEPLPSSEAEFRALNAEAWRALRDPSSESDDDQLLFSDCFRQLLQAIPLPKRHATTEFGNYMLMQSLLTQIHFERRGSACFLNSQAALPALTIDLYDNAFNTWQSGWDLAMDSALDPSSFHGPLAFNSTAMLRLAHVQLVVDIPSQYTLAERDPSILAHAFDPDLELVSLGSPHLHQSIMHAVEALRIPIRVGIAFVASGRTGHWSVQHAISNFYCALLLTHWLESVYRMVEHRSTAGLSREERHCLSTVERLVEETHLEESLGASDDYPLRIRRVAVSALRLWAETCKGAQVYEIVYVIGETLARAADNLEGMEVC